MRQLKDLDVHEISLVRRAANKRRYLIVKSDLGAPNMAKPQSAPTANVAHDLMAAMANIPKQKLEHIASIAKFAKARVHKAEGDEGEAEAADAELTEDAQNALKAAFRILAPYSESITANTMADFADALGVEADVQDDADGDADAETDADDDSVTLEDDTQKSDDGKALDDMQKADDGDDKDEDKDEAQKAAKSDDVPPSVEKADGMPDFADAKDEDLEAAMAAARQAYAEAMKQRGLKEASQEAAAKSEDDEQDEAQKSAVTKSEVGLDGLGDEQRRILEPVLKSHFARMSELERINKELVAKSAKAEAEAQRKEFVAKAAREYASLGPAEEIGANLMRLHQKDPDGVAAWERIMKAANEQMRSGGASGLFQELGSAMASQEDSSDPTVELNRHLDAIVQKSGETKSREQHEADFFKTPVGRRLYTRINAQQNTRY